MNEATSIFVVSNVTLADKVRLARTARRWTQLELAVHAHVQPSDVSALERGYPILTKKQRRILAALGLEDDSA